MSCVKILPLDGLISVSVGKPQNESPKVFGLLSPVF